MAVLSDTLEQARRLHQAGKLAEAERAYHQVLQANGHDAGFLAWFIPSIQTIGLIVSGEGKNRKLLLVIVLRFALNSRGADFEFVSRRRRDEFFWV